MKTTHHQHDEEEHREHRRGERTGRFRLLAEHQMHGRILPAGTEVGDGTEYPLTGEPSNLMEGLDETGRHRVDELHKKLYGRDAPWQEDFKRDEAARKEAERQREETLKQEPVSPQQAWERGHEEFRGKKLVGRPGAPHPEAEVDPTLSKGGDTGPSIGMPPEKV